MNKPPKDDLPRSLNLFTTALNLLFEVDCTILSPIESLDGVGIGR